MVRVRLADESLTDDLTRFLRRCECDVEHLGPGTLAVAIPRPVDVAAAVRHLKARRCYRCGATIEATLYRLGSGSCHDCRESARDERPPEARIHDDWTRMEIEAYLKVWLALHPEGDLELVA